MSIEDLSYIRKKLEEHEERISYLENFFNKQEIKTIKKLSIREFLISKNPKNDVQKTLGICYYLETYEHKASFNKEDIEEGFRRAKEKVPDNINYKVFRNIKNGYLMEAKNKLDNLKTWTLTNSGIEFVENSFLKSLEK